MRVIYCAGEQGQVTLDILQTMGKTDDVVFADDNESLHNKEIQKHPVIGTIDDLPDTKKKDVSCIVAFGDRQETRLELAEQVDNKGYSFFNAVHKSTAISDSASLGKGVTVNAQSYLGPDVTISDHALIDSSVSLSHGVTVDRGATITPGVTICGDVCIEEDAYIGPGATITENTVVERQAVIGAGAVVTDDVAAKTTVLGVPASPVNS